MADAVEPDLTARLQRALSARRDEMKSLVSDLVRIPTENPPGRHYRAAIDRLAAGMTTLELTPEIVRIPAGDGAEPRFAIRASLGGGPQALVFHGHYDVVPASRPGQFDPVWDGDTLFGRGSADMKGGLVAMLYAAWALADVGIPLDGRVSLLFVPDEETGGVLGSQYLAANGLLDAGAVGMLTAEPTSGVVWNANRGAISLLVTVKGRAAHVGLQHLGVNAFERMTAVAGLLAELKNDVESRRTGYALAPDAARSSILLIGGRSEGGTNFNVVPEECRFTVDRRMNPEEDFETEKQRLLQTFDEARRRGIDVEVQTIQEGEPAGSPTDSPLAEALRGAIEAVAGITPSFEMCPGLLETRFYARRGVPAFAYGPGLLSVAHGPKEFVKLESILECAAVYALTAARVVSSR
jgi:acetylornithine deacetylase/succinyl-diaminopimelate desuccinylase family protein